MSITVAMPLMGTSLFRKYMQGKYIKSIEKAGGKVLVIELTDKKSVTEKTLSCDALLLPGGADIEPSLYGCEREEKCGKPNTARDTYEKIMYEAFLPTEKPVLGICRGFQLINILEGGTLFQDISKTRKCSHSEFFSKNKFSHSVTLTENTKLFDIFAEKKINVNSIHHQAVNKTGDKIIVSAVSEDGFVEGIELKGHPFCIGVQWHPEHMYDNDTLQQKLFSTFIKASE